MDILPAALGIFLECADMSALWLGATCCAGGKRRHAAAVPRNFRYGSFGLRWQPKSGTALGNWLNTYDARRGSVSKQTCFHINMA